MIFSWFLRTTENVFIVSEAYSPFGRFSKICVTHWLSLGGLTQSSLGSVIQLRTQDSNEAAWFSWVDMIRRLARGIWCWCRRLLRRVSPTTPKSPFDKIASSKLVKWKLTHYLLRAYITSFYPPFLDSGAKGADDLRFHTFHISHISLSPPSSSPFPSPPS